jgi:hypothetical protein
LATTRLLRRLKQIDEDVATIPSFVLRNDIRDEGLEVTNRLAWPATIRAQDGHVTGLAQDRRIPSAAERQEQIPGKIDRLQYQAFFSGFMLPCL